MTAIEATAVIAAPPEQAFAFLSELENHWEVAGRWIEVIALDADGHGGRVRIRAPFGLRRTVTTRVEVVDPPRSLRGSATLGRTCAEVSWTLHPTQAGGTGVRLAAVVRRAGAVDRALLALGGAEWMRHLFALTLARLGTTLTAPAPARPAVQLSSARA